MELATIVLQWVQLHHLMFWSISAVSVLFFIGTAVMLPSLVARIPRDYFLPTTDRSPWHASPSSGRFVYHLIKTIAGVVLIMAGIVMLFIPGQGIITILMGIILMDFPGKRRLALRIVRNPTVLRSINWMRARSNRPPLVLP